MQAVATGRVPTAARDNADVVRRRLLERVIWASAMAVLTGAVIAGEAGSVPGSYLALDIAVGVTSVALVPLLGRWPVPVAVLLSLLAAVSPAATPSATMAVLLVAAWQPLAVSLAVAGTGIAAHLIRGAWRPVDSLPYIWWVVLVCAAYAALAGWGMLVRAHGALISSLRERAEQAEADQARRVAEARAAERTRIAREMHDVLAHRLSLLATYAGALAYRPDAPPEQLSRAAEVVRSGAHQALEELREVIGVLRDDELPDLTAGNSPLPGVGELPQLIDESRAAGLRVEVSGETWDAALVPGALGRTVYRVLQEGLTNVRKHAPDETARVALSGGPGEGLGVAVVSRLPSAPPAGFAAGAVPGSAPAPGGGSVPGGVPVRGGVPVGGGVPVPGTGTGLIGLAERVELAGGTLETGPRDGEFVLRAWLPWPP
jgi:signal transduction histidine kinase